VIELRESDLLAVHLPPGPAWLEVLDRARDAGAAVMPIDVRLSPGEVDALLRIGRPTASVAGDGFRRLDGLPCEAGVGFVVATSGSSAQPRLVELTHDAVNAAVHASLARIGRSVDDSWLCCLPVAHMGGLLVVMRARAAGVPVAFGGLEPGSTRTAVVPTQLVRALADGTDLSGFRTVLVGGAALGPALAEAHPVVTTYGMTESAGGVVYDGLPLDGVHVRISPDDEIRLRGPTMMRRYRLDPEATARAFPGDGWLRTRDAGRIVDGRLQVLGRLDDAIVTGGEKVFPLEVEGALRRHPKVADVAVAGRPDPEWGARVVAFIEPAGDAPSLDELRDFARAQLAAFKLPRELVVVDALPRTPLGKVRLRDLIDRGA
jgi:O-succinylbenzoic acid--CoA ligase